MDGKKLIEKFLCFIKGLFQFKRKNLSHWFRRIYQYIFSFCPDTLGLLNKSIMFSKTVCLKPS